MGIKSSGSRYVNCALTVLDTLHFVSLLELTAVVNSGTVTSRYVLRSSGLLEVTFVVASSMSVLDTPPVVGYSN